MNEQNPEAVPTETSPPPLPYRDRSTGLIIFGVLTIFLGVLCALFIPLMLFGQAASARATGAATPVSAILPAIFIYGIAAVGLVWLGIGSIAARRWARALLLIFSWSWLLLGILVLLMMLVFIPKVMATLPAANPGRPAPPAAALGIAMVVMFLVMGVGFVIMPAVWVFFYGSKQVKATCENRDSQMRWTDGCPLPVLAMSLWLWFAVPMMLLMPIIGHGVIPFFGMFLSGLPGTVFCLIASAIWGVSARWLYHLDRRGWWLILMAMGVYTISSILTFSQHDMTEMYRLMDYPEAQIERMQKMGLWPGNSMLWVMLISVLPFFGYLIYLKKFFPTRTSAAYPTV